LLYFGQSREQVMHTGPQGAAAFAVDDADAEKAAFAAFGEVFGQEAADLAWTEGVQIKFRADGVLHQLGDRVVIGLRHEWSVCLGKGVVQWQHPCLSPLKFASLWQIGMWQSL
jgi:hypothetical protein